MSSFDWIDFSRLNGVGKEIEEILSGERVQEFIDEEKRKALTTGITNRIHQLQEIAMTHTQRLDFGSQEDDVEEDVAEDYGMKFE